MRKKDGFVLREVCGEKVIVGEGLGAIDFGKLVSLNDTAAWLWNKTGEMGEFDADSLAALLCEVYDVSLETARADVENLLNQWQDLGIVE